VSQELQRSVADCLSYTACQNACVSQELQRSVADGKPGELVTWTPEPETGTIPRYVADGLDAVVTLGGDGTVLWTCSILGNGSVPPLVPFAMGSLGFMTPFAMEKMTKTLEQVCIIVKQVIFLLCRRFIFVKHQ